MRSFVMIAAFGIAPVLLAGNPEIVQTNAAPGFGSYTYDGSGNIIQAGPRTYQYDRLGRLSSVTNGSLPEQAYTYDRHGNMLTMTTSSVNASNATTSITTRLGVNPATNRIDQNSTDGVANNMVATYDTFGNVTWSPTATFTYDQFNLSKESNAAGLRTLYLYSASDERVASVHPDYAKELWTIRDPGGRVLRRMDRTAGTWSWSQDYIYGAGRLLASEIPGSAKVLHYHADHLGTPRLITGNGGAQVGRHDYYPFGFEMPGGTNDGERLKFTGHERDTATLDYMHARYYDSSMARFLSVDPSRSSVKPQHPQSWNRYAYARNNPLTRVDPDGRADKDYRLLTIPINIIYSEADYGASPTVRERTEAGLRKARTDFSGMGITFKVRRFEAGSLVNPSNSLKINGPIRTSTGDVSADDFYAATKGKEINVLAAGRLNRRGASDGALTNIVLGALSDSGTLSHELGHSLGNSPTTMNLVKYWYTESVWMFQDLVNFTDGFEALMRTTAEEIACVNASNCGGAFEPEQK